MISALPPPPAVEQPAPYQLSSGLIVGIAAPGTRRVIVRVGTRTLADRPLRQSRFQLRVSLPSAETAVQVITVDEAGARSRTTVEHILGAGATSAPRLHTPHSDALLEGEIRRLAQSFGNTSAIYVQDLATGAGAAWNARATFPAASALKPAVAVTPTERPQPDRRSTDSSARC